MERARWVKGDSDCATDASCREFPMLLRRDAFPPAIASVDDWLKEWPPQMGLKQWQNGKSAKELAKAWFKTSGPPAIPAGLQCLLESCPSTRELTIEAVIGEVKVPLDHGRPRHADLVLKGNASDAPVLIHVEAKADEEFAKTCEGAWKAALRKEGPASTLPQRMSRLSHLLFGTSDFDGSLDNMPARFRRIRYQLLYATAAAILDAARQRITTAVFVVHELLPNDMTRPFLRDDGSPRPLLSMRRANQNAKDLNDFAAALTTGRVSKLPISELIEVGVFAPDPGDWLHLNSTVPVRLFMGKARDATVQSSLPT